MALATYNDLKSAVANWLRRSDLSPYLDDLITLAETRINREVRTREMESALAVTVSGSGTASVPSDFLGLKYAYISGSPIRPLMVASPRQIFETYPTRSVGDATMVAADGANFVFGPVPSQNSILTGTYYAKPSALSSAVGNLFTAHPDLYLFAALAETNGFVKDERRAAVWEQKYQMIRDEVNRQDQNTRFSGPIAITVG